MIYHITGFKLHLNNISESVRFSTKEVVKDIKARLIPFKKSAIYILLEPTVHLEHKVEGASDPAHRPIV